jgi:hypothetical protein
MGNFEAFSNKKRKNAAFTAFFLYYRKLRKINLAVLHCLNTSETWIGKQSPAGVARFLFY